jgi:hypothetical protein
LAALCGIAYLLAYELDSDAPLSFTLSGLIAGWIALITMAPARLTFPLSLFPKFLQTVKAMHFVPTDDTNHWTYDRPPWMKWSNSDLIVCQVEGAVAVSGPLSTLVYIWKNVSGPN